MTGQRPSPRGRGDPWRGGRAQPGQGGPTSGHEGRHDVELEELPPALLASSGRRRVGASTTVAAVALVGLLAAGFGVLGGRPDASPSPSAAGNAVALESGASATEASAPSGPTPRVTPAEPCGPEPERPPRVYLEVNGVSTRGAVQQDGITPTPGGVGVIVIDPPQPVVIPTGATTEIWIAGAACAAAWHIRLAVDDGVRIPVAIQSNPSLDPAIALRNRFQLAFGDERNVPGEHHLEAGLDFPGSLRVVATWPIRFLPIVRPRATLLVIETGRSIDMVEGCDVVLTLRNGDEQRPGCDRDLSTLPGPPTKLAEGTALEVEIAGWSVTDMVVNCGSQSDRVFTATPGARCIPVASGTGFSAPTPGNWTLAVAACAVGYTQFASNRICGTWYASIDTRLGTRNGGS